MRSQPVEYITLPAGERENYSEVYDKRCVLSIILDHVLSAVKTFENFTVDLYFLINVQIKMYLVWFMLNVNTQSE